jgi:hypothetical protein
MSAPDPAQKQPATTAFSFLRSRPKSFVKQLEEASVTACADASAISDLPTITWGSRRFVLDAHLDRKRSKGRRSWITLHGDFLSELNPDNTVKKQLWTCRICAQTGVPQFFVVQSTSSAISHLQNIHSVVEFPVNQDGNPTVLELQQTAGVKRPASNIPRTKTKRIRELGVGYILNSNLPFSCFEDPFLQELFVQFDGQLAKQVSLGRNTMSADLSKLFEEKKAVVKSELRDAATSIHFSFDLWTSPNHIAFVAIIGHFLDRDHQYQIRVLGFRRQIGTHTGENIAHTLENVIRDWGIEGQVGAAICDNASNNDTCLESLYPRLDPRMKPVDVKARRMRCFGHILNLVSKAFLFGDDADTFELQSDAFDLLDQHNSALRHWRRKGPIGKLHNIVKFIRASPQRIESFKRTAREHDASSSEDHFSLVEESLSELELKQNNATRWNSTYLMIKRAWEKQSHIQSFIMALELDPTATKIPPEDQLHAEDWRLLAEIQHVLEPIYKLTMRTQGWAKGDSHGQLWEVMTGMEYVLEHLEDWKALYCEQGSNQLNQLHEIR